jgi:Family of unknown function (DUF5681)
MNDETRNGRFGDYEVGYGKPPAHTRFRKGQSGNPHGRPRGFGTKRLPEILLKEAYRKMRVKQGDRIEKVPAMVAIARSLVTRAAAGNGRAQQVVLDAIEAIERERATQVAAEAKEDRVSSMSRFEIARRIAFALATAAPETTAEATDNKEFPQLVTRFFGPNPNAHD